MKFFLTKLYFFCHFKNGQNSFCEPGKSLKLSKMQFHEKKYLDLFDFTSFFAWTFTNFLARRCVPDRILPWLTILFLSFSIYSWRQKTPSILHAQLRSRNSRKSEERFRYYQCQSQILCGSRNSLYIESHRTRRGHIQYRTFHWNR